MNETGTGTGTEGRFERPEDFYAVYDGYRDYVRPDLAAKHIRLFDANIWRPGRFHPDMAVLEFGCGTGIFLAYLLHKGVGHFIGVDQDANLRRHMPDEIAEHFAERDIWSFLDSSHGGERFDRIVMLDVLEHFSVYQAVDLLRRLKSVLTPEGQVIVRVPNPSSPWGLRYQHHDLTHKAAYSPGGLHQIALAAGYGGATCRPHRRRFGLRQGMENAAQGLLAWVIVETPEIWTANMMGFISLGTNSGREG